MSIESGSVCINCENLSASFRCSKHDIDVDLDNVCSDHSLKRSISKLSNCLNCEKYSTKNVLIRVLLLKVYFVFLGHKNFF